MISEDKKCNDLTGKEWLQNSLVSGGDLSKTKEEKALKHPAAYTVHYARNYCTHFQKGKNVLDPFNGIGTTMAAAHNLKSKCTGIDL